MATQTPKDRVRLSTIRRWCREGQRFPMLTCYDATTARWLWDGGVQALLVGDTAGQFVLGHESTLPAPMDFMVEITAAVRRGAPSAFIMADMPFGSYQCGDDQAVANAMRYLTQAHADVVKFEVDASFAPLVERLSHAGVPVVAHLGSLPQHSLHRGRYRLVVTSQDQVRKLVDDACLMVRSGAVMLLFEAVPAEVTEQVIAAIADLSPADQPVPVIGCGAGPACHGHVVVLHDLLGLTDWHAPFAPPMAKLGGQIKKAAKAWRQLIESGQYLQTDHPYHLEG